MKRLLSFKKLMFLFVVMLFTTVGFGQYLTESFEGTWSGTPASPTGWTSVQTATGTGTNGTDPIYWEKNTWSGTAWSGLANGVPTTPAGAQDLTSVAWFNDYKARTQQKQLLATPTLDLTASTNPLISFYWATSSSSSVVVKLKGSIDGGTSWNDIQTLTKPELAWTNTKIEIPAIYKVATAKFGFEVTAAWGTGSDVWIDNVVIREGTTPDAAPTTLTFTSTTATGMTVNWIDNSTNETGFRIYYSVDNTLFFKYGSDIASTTVATTANPYSQALVGLLPGTTYYFKVVSFIEFESSSLTGSQATNAAGEIVSEVAGGLWSATTTWVGGVVPTIGDNVTIVDGSTVTLDVAGTCNNLTVGQGTTGILSMNAFTLTVANNVTIAAGGKIDVLAGTAANLTVNGNLTNNGTLDLSNSSIYGKLTFTTSSNSTFTLNTGSVSDFDNGTATRGVNINKGTSIASVLDFVYNGGTLSAQGLTTTATNGFFYITNGTLKISGTGTVTFPIFSIPGITIPATGGVWLNNANFTVKGQNGSPTLNGKLQITNGIFNIGTSTNSIECGSGAIILIEGGIFNVSSRLNLTLSTNKITYTQTAGIVYVNSGTANETTTKAAFDMGTSTLSSFTMSGGSIVICRTLSTNTVFRGPAISSTLSITGGTLQLGTDVVTAPAISATAAGQTFRIKETTPNLVVNSTNNPNVTLSGFTYVIGDLTINGTGTFSLNTNNMLAVLGYDALHPGNIVNNGTMTFNAGSTGQLYLASEFGNQVFTNNGTITGNAIPILSIENIFPNGTVTIPAITIKDGASLSGKLNLYEGTLICPTLTLGGGVAGTGGFNCNMSGGILQNAPTFDFGTGTVTYTYDAWAAQTTGVELPASLTNATNSNKIVINNAAGVTLNSALSVDKLTLTAGNLTTTSTNLLTILNTTTTAITQTSGYVKGPLALTLPASLVTGSTYFFPIGKGISNKLELVNPTTNSGGSVVIKAEVFDVNSGGTSTQFLSLNDRYWVTEILSGSVNFDNTTISLTETVPTLDNTYGIGQSATLAGTYTLVSSSAAVGSKIASDVVTSLGYFTLGIKSTPVINITPTSLDFGYYSSGTTSAVKTYVISGMNLTPAAGNITITPPANFEVSTDGTTFSSSAITVAYTGGTLSNTTISVVFKPTTASILYSGTITNGGGGITGTSDVTVTGSTKSPAKDITSFSFASPAATGTINGTNITLNVPFATDLTALVPTIVVSDNATVSPLTGVAQNFTSPVNYTVTAEDLTTKVYTVSVKKIFDIPYTQNFDGVTAPTLPEGWSVETQAVAWRTATTPSLTIPISAPNSLATFYHSNGTSAKNDWAFSPALQLDQTKTYIVKFKIQAPGWNGTPEKLEVKLGNTANSTSMTTQLWNDANLLQATAVEKTFTFSPTTSGVYYLGWHAYSVANVGYIAIDDISITLPVLPTLTTAAISGVTANSAISGGDITNNGGVPVTKSGVVYSSTDDTPQIGESGVTEITTNPLVATGAFVSNLTSLTGGTTYYVSAYATNSVGTAYGNIVSFAPSAIDMGALALVTPTTSGCYTSTETVKVQIKNYSNTSIDFAVDNVTVNAAVTGTNATVFTPVVLNSGTLASGATQDVIFSSNYDMSANGIYTFNASTTVTGDGISTNDAITAVEITNMSLGGTYTVGVGGDYTTLTDAINDLYLMTCMTAPIVYSLTDATYTNETLPIYVGANSNFSATNTVTFKNANGVTPIISALGTSLTDAAILVDGADYITFDGINIIDAGTTTADQVEYGYYFASLNNLGVDAATNNTVKNCNITLGGGGIISSSACGVGIFNAAAATAGNSNNKILNINVDNANRGVLISGADLTANPTAAPDNNNEISDCDFGATLQLGSSTATGSAYGISVSGNSNIKIYNNILHQIYCTNTASTSNAIGFSFINTNGNVYDNEIHGVRHAGTSATVRAIGIQASTVNLDLNIYNNYIANILKDYNGAANATIGVFGIRSTNSSVPASGTVNYYNNTVVLNAPAPVTYSSIAFGSFAGGVPMVAKNNIFVNNISTSDATAKAYVIQDANTTPKLTSDYNDLVGTGTNSVIGILGTTNQVTFADWKTASSQDANSVNVAPVFVAANDYHLDNTANCDIADKGTPIALVTNDLDGDVRNATTPDLGADEFELPNSTASISDLSTSGFTVHLTNSIAGLTETNFSLSPIVTITSATTTDGGASYQIVATLTQAVEYTLTTISGCYVINAPKFTISSTYDVTFSAIGSGSLNATVDGSLINSPAVVDANKDVIFTASPDNGYRVKEWIKDGTPVLNNTTTNYSILGISSDANVTVEFEVIPVLGTAFNSFSFPANQQSGTAVINSTNHTINISVVQGTPLTALKASFTLSTGATATVGTTPQISGNTPNNFTSPVTYTVTNAKVSQDWIVTVSVINAINSLDNESKVYPNPTTGLFVVETTSTNVVVCDATGRIVYSNQVNGSQIQIDLTNQASGLYFVKLVENGNVVIKKLVKE